MPEGLVIKIGAETGEVSKSLSQLQAQLKSFKSGLDKATSTDSIGRLNRAIGVTEKQIAALKGFKGADPKGIVPGTNQAANALQNLGRIAQDAPFGFIGISNNINPLLESFQRLKAESGSTKGALQALVGSLAGGAGLGLAVSIGTGLLAAFGDKLFKAKKATDGLTDSQKEYADAQKSTAESIQKQVIEVESLVRIATSDVSTKKQQADALTRLNELIPDNIGKVTALNIKTNEGISIIREYTKALEDQATAELLRGRAAELRVSKFDAYREATKTVNKLDKTIANLNETFNANEQSATAQTRSSENFATRQASITQQIQAATREREEALKKFVTVQKDADIELGSLRKEIDRATAGGLSTTIQEPKDKAGRTKREEDALQTRINQLEALKNATGLLKKEEFELLAVRIQLAQRDQGKNGLDDSQLQRFIQSLKESADLEVDINTKLLIPDPPKINTDLALVGAQLRPLKVPIGIDTSDAAQKLKAFQDTMQSALQSAASSIAQGLGDVLGEALSGGNPLAAGLSLIADTLVQLGKAAVGAGIAMLSLKTLFKNPATAIAAGIAAIALGTAIKSSIPKFAEGGVVTGPTMGLIGEAGPEVIFPLSKLNQFIGSMNKGTGDAMTVEHKVQGQDLLLVINRAQNRWGGSNRF